VVVGRVRRRRHIGIQASDRRQLGCKWSRLDGRGSWKLCRHTTILRSWESSLEGSGTSWRSNMRSCKADTWWVGDRGWVEAQGLHEERHGWAIVNMVPVDIVGGVVRRPVVSREL
jgi:hypothetical protein